MRLETRTVGFIIESYIKDNFVYVRYSERNTCHTTTLTIGSVVDIWDMLKDHLRSKDVPWDAPGLQRRKMRLLDVIILHLLQQRKVFLIFGKPLPKNLKELMHLRKLQIS